MLNLALSRFETARAAREEKAGWGESNSRYMHPMHAYSPLRRVAGQATTTFPNSGCRESNPVYMHPMHAYYRYTTARSESSLILSFLKIPNKKKESRLVWVAKPALEKIWYNLSVKLGLSGWSGWRWRGLGN